MAVAWPRSCSHVTAHASFPAADAAAVVTATAAATAAIAAVTASRLLPCPTAAPLPLRVPACPASACSCSHTHPGQMPDRSPEGHEHHINTCCQDTFKIAYHSLSTTVLEYATCWSLTAHTTTSMKRLQQGKTVDTRCILCWSPAYQRHLQQGKRACPQLLCKTSLPPVFQPSFHSTLASKPMLVVAHSGRA